MTSLPRTPSQPLLVFSERLRALATLADEGAVAASLGIDAGDARWRRIVAEAAGRATPALYTLFPAVLVAWADGAPDEHERHLVRALAWELELDRDARAWALLERWLEARPGVGDGAAWHDFVDLALGALPALDYEAWRHDVIECAWSVAMASGGGWLTSPVSALEREVLANVEATLAPGAHLGLFS